MAVKRKQQGRHEKNSRSLEPAAAEGRSTKPGEWKSGSHSTPKSFCLLSFTELLVEVLATHLAACKDFQQVTGNKEPQNSCEAQQVSQAEVLPVEQVVKMVEEKRTPCEEVEHLNKELQVCLQPWMGKESLGESGMFLLAVTLQKMHANGFGEKWK
ncbi:hypothetical protein DUI87_06226 [Hirundo rustica rustica]|uniref:Uncharacterized protein n=1 Tax=Hirundo rustica rustica TaxID=333673 RepID=A0A3M0L1S3_HIRRU|nr:hypothetical protein DUI87_06226 [Hirundo rustica rustica]